MRKNWLIIYFLGFILLNSANAQSFANKEYYLVDSLDLTELSVREQLLLDSSLAQYHAAKHDTSRIKALNILIEASWDDKLWSKYNLWVYDFLELKLGKKSLSFNPERDNTTKFFLLKSFTDAISRIGLIEFDQGNYSKALKSHSKA